MTRYITEGQYDNLMYARPDDIEEFNELLKEYTGIVAKQYTAFQYYDSADNYVGNSEEYTLDELLESACVEVYDD